MSEYAFETTSVQGFLHVRVQGPKDVQTIRRYVGDLVEACVRGQCPFVLIEEKLEGPRFSLTEIFQVISEHIEAVRSALRLIAFVDASPERNETNNKFAENVAANRGLQARTFATAEDAGAWLRREIAARANRKAPN